MKLATAHGGSDLGKSAHVAKIAVSANELKRSNIVNTCLQFTFQPIRAPGSSFFTPEMPSELSFS